MYYLPPVKGGIFMPMIVMAKDFPNQGVLLLIYIQHMLNNEKMKSR
jgi:hypothetical protein